MKDKFKQAVFTVQEQTDQPRHTFASAYYKALFDTTDPPANADDTGKLQKLNFEGWRIYLDPIKEFMR